MWLGVKHLPGMFEVLGALLSHDPAQKYQSIKVPKTHIHHVGIILCVSSLDPVMPVLCEP